MPTGPGHDPDVVFEKVFSTTPGRKLGELVLDRSEAVQTKLPHFLKKVGRDLRKDDRTLYQAMSVAGARFPLLGGAPGETFATLRHAASAESVYETNVSLAWKLRVAHQLNLPWRHSSFRPPDGPVYLHWQGAVSTTGTNLPAKMLSHHSAGASSGSWWSPDARMNLTSSSTPEQAAADFFAMSQIVSLAPEWYPQGLALLTITDASSTPVVRPSPYDGMTSPLWVQRPPDRPARTGGAALETLLAQDLRLSQIDSVAVFILDPALETALGSAASVDDYAADLRLVKPGDTPESRRVAEMQIQITEECRASRAVANHEFAELILQYGGPSLAAAAVETSTDEPVETPAPAGVSPLAQTMEQWGRLGLRRHRGDRFPSDRFTQEARLSGTTAIHEAAAELLRISDDPGVVRLVLNVGGAADHRPFFDALLERLEGRGLPDGAGQISATLREDGMLRLVEGSPSGDAALARRVDAVLEHAGRSDLRLLLLCREAPDDETEAMFSRVAAQRDVDPNVLALAAVQLARHRPDRLVVLASQLHAQSVEARRWIADAVRQGAPEWFAQHGAALAPTP